MPEDRIKHAVLAVVRESYGKYPLSLTFDRIERLTWQRIVAQALVDLIDEGEIRCANGNIYVPDAPKEVNP